MITRNEGERNTCGCRTMLPISSIRTDGGTQPRATIDFSAVDDYMDAMLAGVTFPPVTVFYDGADYWLADGFHRCKAASQAGLEEIACDIRQGTQQDAQWYSFSANKTNGLRRTNEDKQRAVKAALGHPGGAGKSDSAIAKHVGVDVKTVGSWRDRLSMEIPKMDHRTVTRGASTYQQNTTNIGRKPARRYCSGGDGDLEGGGDGAAAGTRRYGPRQTSPHRNTYAEIYRSDSPPSHK